MRTRTTPRRTQAERTALTRSRLVAAALSVLQQKGYTGFRVSEVSLVAKVSRGAQTHHFATKDSLVLAAVEEFFAASEARTMRRRRALKPSHDLVAELIKDGVEFFLGPFFVVILDLLSVGHPDGPFRQAIVAISREHRMGVEREWLAALIERGASRARAESALALAYNAIRGMVVRRFIDDNTATRKRWLADLQRIVTAMLESEA